MQENNTNKFCFIALHLGAGSHSISKKKAYKKLTNDICKKSMQDLVETGATALSVLVKAIVALENSSVTNSGSGSNCNEEGNIEMDAAIMIANKDTSGGDKTTIGGWAGVGAARLIQNPILVAESILQNYLSSQSKQGIRENNPIIRRKAPM